MRDHTELISLPEGFLNDDPPTRVRSMDFQSYEVVFELTREEPTPLDYRIVFFFAVGLRITDRWGLTKATSAASGRLVEFRRSRWLESVRRRWREDTEPGAKVRHLCVRTPERACYEALCLDVEVSWGGQVLLSRTAVQDFERGEIEGAYEFGIGTARPWWRR